MEVRTYLFNRRNCMSRKIWIAAGILILGITPFKLLNQPFVSDTHIANQEPLLTIEESTLNKVIEKLHEKYVGVDVKTTSNKELKIQVIGDEEYFNSVKKDMEYLVSSIIESSILKDYIVVFERWDLIGDASEIFNKELQLILQTLMNGLKDYQEIKRISTEFESQKSVITIHTSIKGSDKNKHKIAMKIEQKVNDIFNSKELNSLSNIDSYSIKIVNTEGLEINS